MLLLFQMDKLYILWVNCKLPFILFLTSSLHWALPTAAAVYNIYVNADFACPYSRHVWTKTGKEGHLSTVICHDRAKGQISQNMMRILYKSPLKGSVFCFQRGSPLGPSQSHRDIPTAFSPCWRFHFPLPWHGWQFLRWCQTDNISRLLLSLFILSSRTRCVCQADVTDPSTKSQVINGLFWCADCTAPHRNVCSSRQLIHALKRSFLAVSCARRKWLSW